MTAQAFDDKIDIIGHGEIKNADSTQNMSSHALSNSLPFQSQNLSQIIRDIQT